MKKISVLTFFILLLFNQLFTFDSEALSCARLLEVEEAYDQYDGVIVGTVDKVIQKSYSEAHVTVKKSYKGVVDSEIIITEDLTWGNLNGPSEAGEEYLFYLNQLKSGKWENPLCSPSKKVADAAKELVFLQDKEILLTDVLVRDDQGEADQGARSTEANSDAENNEVAQNEVPPQSEASHIEDPDLRVFPIYWTILVALAIVLGLTVMFTGLRKRTKR